MVLCLAPLFMPAMSSHLKGILLLYPFTLLASVCFVLGRAPPPLGERLLKILGEYNTNTFSCILSCGVAWSLDCHIEFFGVEMYCRTRKASSHGFSVMFPYI